MDTVISRQMKATSAMRSAMQDVLHEARDRWGEVVELPVDLALLAGDPAVGLTPAATFLLLGSVRPQAAVWLAPRDRREPVRAWLSETLDAVPVEVPARGGVAVLRAASAEPALWDRLGAGLLLVEVPGLAVVHGAMPWAAACHLEPGDADLTPRIAVQAPGQSPVHRLSVSGLSRQFWRERAAAQRGGDFDVDLLLVHRARCCYVPAAALVSVLP